MEYRFKDYLFKSDQLVLKQDAELVKLRPNEAKLLALLLSNPDKVFSKEEIFQKVWTDKVVSDQPVFQNISRLRAIFGDKAIINHPKKGYQWQIPLIPKEPDIAVIVPPVKSSHYNLYAVLGLICIVCLAILYFGSHSASGSSPKVSLKLALMPILDHDNLTEQDIVFNQLQSQLANFPSISIKHLERELDYRKFEANLPYLLTNKLVEHQADGLLLLNLSKKYDQFYMSYNVVSNSYQWQGELLADDLAGVLNKLRQQLVNMNSAQIINQSDLSVRNLNAKLQLLNQTNNDDLAVLQQLVESQISIRHFDEALILAQRLQVLSEQQKNSVYLAHAYRKQGEIYLQQQHFSYAKRSLEQAAQIYREYGDWTNLIKNLQLMSHLGFAKQNYQQIKLSLSESIRLAMELGDYKSEFDLNFQLSIMAYKFKQVEDQALYYQRAINTFQSHYFDVAAQIHLHFYDYVLGGEKQSEPEMVEHLQKVLSIAKQFPKHFAGLKGAAQGELAKLYMSQKRFAEALKQFDFERKLTPGEKLTVTRIYNRWGKRELAVDYGHQAFSDALFSGEVWISLDSALLLIELANNREGKSIINIDTYAEYIRENVYSFWLRHNHQRLTKSNIPTLVDLVSKWQEKKQS